MTETARHGLTKARRTRRRRRPEQFTAHGTPLCLTVLYLVKRTKMLAPCHDLVRVFINHFGHTLVRRIFSNQIKAQTLIWFLTVVTYLQYSLGSRGSTRTSILWSKGYDSCRFKPRARDSCRSNLAREIHAASNPRAKCMPLQARE